MLEDSTGLIKTQSNTSRTAVPSGPQTDPAVRHKDCMTIFCVFVMSTLISWSEIYISFSVYVCTCMIMKNVSVEFLTNKAELREIVITV